MASIQAKKHGEASDVLFSLKVDRGTVEIIFNEYVYRPVGQPRIHSPYFTLVKTINPVFPKRSVPAGSSSPQSDIAMGKSSKLFSDDLVALLESQSTFRSGL